MIAIGTWEMSGATGFSTGDNPAVHVQKKLLEGIRKPFGMSTWIVADRARSWS